MVTVGTEAELVRLAEVELERLVLPMAWRGMKGVASARGSKARRAHMIATAWGRKGPAPKSQEVYEGKSCEGFPKS